MQTKRNRRRARAIEKSDQVIRCVPTRLLLDPHIPVIKSALVMNGLMGKSPGGRDYPVVPVVHGGPEQVVYDMEVPGGIQKLTTVAGIIASAVTVTAGLVSTFSSRFASLFDEYRIIGVNFHCIPLYAGTQPGATAFCVDENDATAPGSTQVIVNKEGSRVLPNYAGAFPKGYVIKWQAKDTADLQFISTGTTNVTSCALKIATDSTTLSAPTAVDLWAIIPRLRIQFRGFVP